MPVHDAYARRTPYERFLPDPTFPDRHFAAIAEEAALKRVALDDPGAFAILEAAAQALAELRTADDDPDALGRHALMLFHAYHHHRADTPLYLLDTAVVRLLTETDPWTIDGEGGHREVPAALYLQFPQHLVWGRADSTEAPESLDGAFRTVTDDGRIHLLPIGGLLGDRPGFTVMAVPGAPAEHELDWATTAMRPDGGDFSTDMPGAEIDRLYEIRTVGEALKLVARAVRVIRGAPGRVSAPVVAAERATAASSAGTPPPSSLPARRVVMEGA